jgi:hypothetical protein
MQETKEIEVDINKKSGKREYVDARFVFTKIMSDRGYAITILSNYLKKHHTTIIYYRNSACDIMRCFLGNT